MTYQQFVKKNLKHYIRAGLSPTVAMRMVARDWYHWKHGTARNIITRNIITSKVNGVLTCDVFPREKGRYEVICSLVRPGREPTFASHGIWPDKETAMDIAKDVSELMRKNPFKPFICKFCDAEIYATITPVKCPRCGKPWKEKNPTLVMPIKSKKQMEHLFKAQSQLSKAGVTFDSGTKMTKPMQRHWELDWSLKGGKMKNPITPEVTTKLDQKITADRGNIRDWFKIPKDPKNQERLTYREVVQKIVKSDKLARGYGSIPDLKIEKVNLAVDPSRPLGESRDIYQIELQGKKLREVPKDVYDYYQSLVVESALPKAEVGTKVRNPYAYYAVDKRGRWRLVVKKKNPLTEREKAEIKHWANIQYGISTKYQDTPLRSAFWRGRAVGMGKVAKAYNPGAIEKTGNILGGMGILAIPAFIGLILWIQCRQKK